MQAGFRQNITLPSGPTTGEVEVGMAQVGAREGLVIENEKMVAINALRDSELILVVTAK